MVLYLSFMQLASRCLVATPPREEQHMEYNQQNQAPIGNPNTFDTQAALDTRAPRAVFWRHYLLPLLQRVSIRR